MKTRQILAAVSTVALALAGCGSNDPTPSPTAAEDQPQITTSAAEDRRTEPGGGPISKTVGEKSGILCNDDFTECEMEFIIDAIDTASSCEDLGYSTYDDSDAGHHLVRIKSRITLAQDASDGAANFNSFADWNALRPDGVTQPLDPAYSCDADELQTSTHWYEPIARGTTVERLDLYRLPEGASKIALIEPVAQAHWEWDAPAP